ncbi:hypothetical protein HHI36_014089 [Cryptolaemus montrouzieri]|uniref:Major facilitator superfamily (MFS) profile domain-containing protein n=1 Tax=Cryptolaemus montrouzieri TaxID=559131 RepID=A0ABD2N2G7_9CUCU
MTIVEGEIINPSAPVKGFGVRHGQVILQILFYVIIYGIELSLSSTIMAIVYSTKDGSYIYSNWWLSQILAAYLYGFLITELFGGWVCKNFGFKWPMVIMMVINSAITLSLPLIGQNCGAVGLLVCRIVQGLCSGLIFAMPADFINKWIPVGERTTLGTAVYSSSRLGEVLIFFGPAFLVDTSLGWQFVYTLYGYLAIIWAILMAVFGADSPEQYFRKITEKELNHIVQNRGNVKTKSKLRIPWMKILTSMPFWAIIVAEIGTSWLLLVLSANMADYFRTHFFVWNTQFFYVIVTLISWILSFVISKIAQASINNGKTTIGQSRKICNLLGVFIPALCLIYFLFEPSGNRYEAVAFWTVMSVASIGTICGAKLNVNDISTNFSAVILGIAAWIGAVFNMLMVIVFQAKFTDNWFTLFLFTIILLLITNIFYLKFGSGEEQDWDMIDDDLDEEVDLSKSGAYISCDEGKYLLYIRKQ